MKSIAQPVAGLDVSKHAVEACVITPRGRSGGSYDDLELLAEYLAGQGVGLAVLEPSGGYERAVMAALEQAGIAFSLVNARHIRHFAHATGQLAKTDRLDARLLADYALRMAPAPRPAPSPDRQQLCALVRRRRQLVEMRKAERTRLQQAGQKDILSDIEELIGHLSTRIKTLEVRIANLIESHPELAKTNRLLRSMPGIGAIAAVTLIAELPELGCLSRRKIAALLGLAPHARDSGTLKGRRAIWGGRAAIRNTLHMSLIAAIRTNNPIQLCYQKLKNRGKPHKLATTAALRKMIVQLNAMIRDNKEYQHSC